MVTPFDAVGGAATFIALGVTVFQGIVKGFVILSTARQLGKDGDLLRSMLEWEHYRLYEWSQQAGLTGENANQALNWPLILNILRQLESQLNDTDELTERYGLVIEEGEDTDDVQDIKEESRLHKLCMKLSPEFYLQTSRAIHVKNKGRPLRRWRWAVMDKSKLERLLQSIRHLTGCLWDVLGFEDRRFIRDCLDRLLRNAIASNPNGSHVDAVSQLASVSEGAISSAGKLKQSRMSLKSNQAAIPSAEGNLSRAQRLKPLKLEYALLEGISGVSEARGITSGRRIILSSLRGRNSVRDGEIVTYSGEKVIVESKSLGNNPKENEKLLFRLENLAILLNSMTHPSFHSLQCLGFARNSNFFIFVFALPKLLGPEANFERPQRLSVKQLRDHNYQPTLDTRLLWAFRIAETVLQLHTAGWLHKDIEPNSVAFILSNKVDLSEPAWATTQGVGIQDSRIVGPFLSNYLSARENSPSAYSEPSFSVAQNAYRHRSVQSAVKCSFRPEFDVYALGLLLIEIGMWCSLDNFLKIDYAGIPDKMGESETIRRIQSKLFFSLPKPFAEAVIMALTYRDLDGDDFLQSYSPADMPRADNEEGDGEDTNDNIDNVDLQQKIVSNLRSCL